MDKVRVGLIGAGSIGVRHMKAMEEVPEIALVAIADPLQRQSGLERRRIFVYNPMLARCWRRAVLMR